LQQVEWFGNPRGYNISYREVSGLVSAAKWRSVTIDDHTANSHILENLEEFAQYEIITQAYNDVGSSSPSPVALERTRESGMFLSSSLSVS
jgi:protein sidekick